MKSVYNQIYLMIKYKNLVNPSFLTFYYKKDKEQKNIDYISARYDHLMLRIIFIQDYLYIIIQIINGTINYFLV